MTANPARVPVISAVAGDLESSQSMRTALQRFAAAGQLQAISRPVDRHFEIGAVLSRLRDGPTALFEQVKDSTMPVVGNMINARRKLALSLSVTEEVVRERMLRCVDDPVSPIEVNDAPCQERVWEADEVDLSPFPFPILSEMDAGPYITAGITIARHPVSGNQNVSISRLQVWSPTTLGINLAPTHHWEILRAYEREGREMPIAIAIGSHPAVQIASQVQAPLGFDELGSAGSLFAEPLRAVHCKAIDIVVPADSEIVLEGVIAPGDVIEEGPFGEFPGTYAPLGRRPRVRILAITTRRQPILQVIMGARSLEHNLTAGLAKEGVLHRAMRQISPKVTRVLLSEGGTCRFSARIAMRDPSPGEAKAVMLAALASQDLLKYVVVVDDDVDVENDRDVEWAVTTRADYSRDVVLVPGMRSREIDPVATDQTVTKMGIDATYPPGVPPHAEAGVPNEVARQVAADWSIYLARAPLTEPPPA